MKKKNKTTGEKLDKTGGTITGNLNIIGSLRVNGKQIDEQKKEILKIVFSVGSTYTTTTDTNPATFLGFGTWERLKGRVIVGLDENDEYFNEIGKEGGETKHIMTIEELVEHNHDVDYAGAQTGINASVPGRFTNSNRKS